MLDVKDDYDFSRKKIAEDIIPERDVPLRIRERIKYDPKKVVCFEIMIRFYLKDL